jgi:hypothetical protein
MSKETDTPKEDAADAGGLAEEVRALREEMTLLRRHRMFVLYQSVARVLLFRFASGMAVGLGTVIGATVLLSIILWLLSQVELIPIIGDWAAEITRAISEAIAGGTSRICADPRLDMGDPGCGLPQELVFVDPEIV